MEIASGHKKIGKVKYKKYFDGAVRTHNKLRNYTKHNIGYNDLLEGKKEKKISRFLEMQEKRLKGRNK